MIRFKTKQLFVAIFILLTATASKQATSQSEIGIKGGINYFNIQPGELNSNVDFKWKDGLSTGIFYNTGKLWGPIGFQAELLYQMKGADIEIENLPSGAYSPYGYPQTESTNEPSNYYNTSERLHYLSLPLLATFSTTKFLDIYAGPELNYLLDKNTTRMETDNLNRFTFGLSTGAKFKLGENTGLDFRYSFDLSHYDNMGSTSNPANLKNNGFAITVQQTLFKNRK